MSAFVDERHALYAGWVMGIAMRYGVPVEPVVAENGDYTDRVIVPFGFASIELVVPPPPDDWDFAPLDRVRATAWPNESA